MYPISSMCLSTSFRNNLPSVGNSFAVICIFRTYLMVSHLNCVLWNPRESYKCCFYIFLLIIPCVIFSTAKKYLNVANCYGLWSSLPIHYSCPLPSVYPFISAYYDSISEHSYLLKFFTRCQKFLESFFWILLLDIFRIALLLCIF